MTVQRTGFARMLARQGGLGLTISAASLLILGVAVVVPLLALVFQAGIGTSPASVSPIPAGHEAALLAKSAAMAGAGAIAALLTSIPGCLCFATATGARDRLLTITLCAVPLLTPSMVYAFAWQGLAPLATPGWLMTLMTWALWAWPIPAAIIGSCWRRDVAGLLDAARLDAPPWPGILYIALPRLSGSLATCWLVLFLVFFSDYGVPHAFGLTVFATNVLATAEASQGASGPFLASLPGLGTTVLALFALYACLRFRTSPRNDGMASPGDSSPRRTRRGPILGMFAVCWVLPFGAMVWRTGSISALSESLRTYGQDLAATLAVAAGSGLMAGLCALGLVLMGTGFARLLGGLTFLTGALPAALTSAAILAAYNRPATALIVDHWPAMLLCHMARFAWIAALAAWLMTRRNRDDLFDQARCDGATRASAFFRVVFPAHRATVVAAGAIVAALATADVAGVSLLRTPDFAPICLVIVEKFHRFEDAMLASLTLWLTGTGALAAASVACARWGEPDAPSRQLSSPIPKQGA